MKDEHLRRDWYMINHHHTEGSIMLLGNCVNSLGKIMLNHTLVDSHLLEIAQIYLK